MKRLSESDLSLRLVNDATDTAMPHSEIIFGGRPTNIIVEGAFLEAALQWNDYVVAFMTHDIPFEESLRIYLFDRQCRTIDSAWIGMMYSTGSFSHLELTGPNTVSFQFMGDGTWSLELLENEEFAIPVIGGLLGVHRPFQWHRHFRVRFQRDSR